MLYLNVPFNEKDEAKSLYAKWDNQKKQWYATKPEFYYKFRKWIPGSIVFTRDVGILEGTTTCWKCKKKTKVFAFSADSTNVFDVTEDRYINVIDETGYDLQLWSISEDIPEKIKEILTKEFGCKIKYSKTVNDTYFANVCNHCDSLQGNYFLYSEVDGPFGMYGDSKLLFYKFKLKNDLPSYLYPDAQISPNYRYMDRTQAIETNHEINI
ncbi:DUF5710 domain-containing protein [Enterococcus sp. BWT-B8]|uniref:DUF5710 domain-containing protein n=1 Tax=Enterococcus sp. BWT-B8 TaxID=2885157 RepID=UPI001E4606F6|nr:DUF5710 domain-containing protein [Enterococcus sp. BWT-B8]MCB5953265.1 DUF5710 domain-containing protein [Enterococcus sp. BWT-B8]